MEIEVIESPGVRESFMPQRSEYIRFYEAWKRVLGINGWQKLSEYFIDDSPAMPGTEPQHRIRLIATFQGPMFREDFRVWYHVKRDDLIFVLAVGIALAQDRHKD